MWSFRQGNICAALVSNVGPLVAEDLFPINEQRRFAGGLQHDVVVSGFWSGKTTIKDVREAVVFAGDFPGQLVGGSCFVGFFIGKIFRVAKITVDHFIGEFTHVDRLSAFVHNVKITEGNGSVVTLDHERPFCGLLL